MAVQNIGGQGQSDANGNVTITFPPTPAGIEYQGSVSVPNAQSGSSFTAYVEGTPIGSFSPPTAFGPLTLNPGEVLSLQGTGCTPNSPVGATFSGFPYDPGTVQPVFPLSTQSIQNAGTVREAFNMAAPTNLANNATFSQTINLLPLERSMVLLFNNFNQHSALQWEVWVQGVQTGVAYFVGTVTAELEIPVTPPSNDVFNFAPISLPVYGTADQQVTVNIKNVNGFSENMQVAILVLPDPDISGSVGNPIIVAGSSNTVVDFAPVLVAPASGLANFGNTFPVTLYDLSANIQGTDSFPLKVVPAISVASTGPANNGLGLTAAFQTLISAPASGTNRFVDSINIVGATALDVIDFTWDGVHAQYSLMFEPGNGFSPGWILTSTGGSLSIKNVTAARGSAYATWHDEIA